MKAIERTLELRANPDKVWEALTDPVQIGRWFPDDGVEFDLNVGADGYFKWNHCGRYAVRVEAIEPKTRIAWRWARTEETPIDEGPTTLVEWTLTPLPGGGTQLELRESGFETLKAFEENSEGWTSELAELVALLEG